ncbi:MAG: bile acid:sodium symporter [Scytonematopsis contorta HA4267-MV1]|nr:bile acid:sodium symporter [Scytonematopsis contorta HA4267-MV1]
MLNILPTSVKIISFLFIFTFLFSVALEQPRKQILVTMSDYGLIRRSLLANFVLVPLVGILLPWLFKLPPEIALGFLFVAAAPGSLLALHFTRVSKGNLAYAIGLVFLLSLLSVVFTPILIHLISPNIASINLPVLPIILLLLLLITFPLLVGQAIQHWLEPVAQKLRKPTNVLSILLFIALTILTSTLKSSNIQALGWNGLAAIASFIAISWGIGWQLGGPEPSNRKVLAISTSMRNVAICQAITSGESFGKDTELAIAGFSQLLAPMNLLFAIVISRMSYGQLPRLNRQPSNE